MMKYQRGMSLNTLMLWGALLFVVALVAMKALPPWIEYGKIVKVVKATAQDGSLKEASVTQVRAAFDKRADIDVIKAIKGEDLEITKEGGDLMITFAYTEKVKLFSNVSLVFDFEGSSAAK
jgi:hypothetical protein